MTEVKGRTTQIMFRVTPELKQQIQEAARAEGLGMSAWLERLAEKTLRRTRKTGRTDGR
jgi:predicted HicB family RNase H-like nuclease